MCAKASHREELSGVRELKGDQHNQSEGEGGWLSQGRGGLWIFFSVHFDAQKSSNQGGTL